MLVQANTILYFQSSLSAINVGELEGFRARAHDFGWHLQVIEYDGAAKSRFQTAGGDIVCIKELIGFWKADGCVVECGGRPPRFSLAEFGKTPVVLLDCHPSDVGYRTPCVYRDEVIVGQCAAKELLSLQLEDYAYLPWLEPRLTWSRVRGGAFAACVTQNGKRHHVFVPESSNVDVIRIRHGLCNWIRSLPRPCGVFASNDIMASLFLEAARTGGDVVPRDFAVVGVDNDDSICENGVVSLTSIELDVQRYGAIAAELLDRRMKRAGTQSCMSASGVYLHRRTSTRMVKVSDARIGRALEFIRKKACSGISPPDVVAEMGCSRRLADLRFREATGRSILDEIHDVRIGKVKELLRRGNCSESFIADSTGYSSLIDLCRVFKRLAGVTMSEYRRMCCR